MIELWVKSNGLRKGHDPNNPELSDVAGPPELVSLAHRVVLDTASDTFVRKGEDVGWEECTRIIYDPSRPGHNRLCLEANSNDLELLAKMRTALQNDYLFDRGD